MTLKPHIAKALTEIEQLDLLHSLAFLQQGDGEAGYRGRMAKYILCEDPPPAKEEEPL